MGKPRRGAVGVESSSHPHPPQGVAWVQRGAVAPSGRSEDQGVSSDKDKDQRDATRHSEQVVGSGALVAEPRRGPTGEYLGLDREGQMVTDLATGAQLTTFERLVDPHTGQTVVQLQDNMDQREIDSRLREENSRLQNMNSETGSAHPASEVGDRAVPNNPADTPPRDTTQGPRPQSPTGPTGSTGSTRTDSTKDKRPD